MTSLRVLGAKRRVGKSERTRVREKAPALRSPITETRNELRLRVLLCGCGFLFVTGVEKVYRQRQMYSVREKLLEKIGMCATRKKLVPQILSSHVWDIIISHSRLSLSVFFLSIYKFRNRISWTVSPRKFSGFVLFAYFALNVYLRNCVPQYIYIG